MIYITGDCHGKFHKFTTEAFPEQKEMTKRDYIIVCGDFGGVWEPLEESSYEKYWLNWLEDKPFTILFVDGNHENFERLYRYPLVTWNGGCVHQIRSSVFHLMRGQVFFIDGCRIFTFGGAGSHDIRDGILDPAADAVKIRNWKRDPEKQFRINKISWWKQEMPSEQEMQEGIRNLEKWNWKVDYIVTHDCSDSTKEFLGDGAYACDELSSYLEEIQRRVQYKKWFFGHLHDDRAVNDKEILLYDQIVRIW